MKLLINPAKSRTARAREIRRMAILFPKFYYAKTESRFHP
jgi:hypothetical protein